MIARSEHPTLLLLGGNASLLCPRRAIQDRHELDPVVPEGKPTGVAPAWVFRAGEQDLAWRAPPACAKTLRPRVAGP